MSLQNGGPRLPSLGAGYAVPRAGCCLQDMDLEHWETGPVQQEVAHFPIARSCD